MNYIGDFVEDFTTLSFKFLTTSVANNTAGVPVTLAGTPVVSVYKEGVLVQSVAGVTLTVDFDSIVGLNHVLLDLSADAFYAPHADYEVIITTGTVSGDSVVGRIVAAFSIENRSLQKALAIVSNIATGAAAAATSAESAVITTGTEVNTYASTQNLDGGYHEVSDVGGALDFYYQFDIGSGNIATSIAMNGRLEGSNDTVGVYAYNWGTTSWNQIGNLPGGTVGSDDGVGVYTVLDVHTGTGANVGKVRIRGLGSGLTSATMFIDRAAMRYAPITAPTVTEITSDIDSNSTKIAVIIADLANGTDGLGALKALIDTIDTVADAIKAKSDQLTFTKALELDTNTQSINGANVVGDGNATPWDGA